MTPQHLTLSGFATRVALPENTIRVYRRRGRLPDPDGFDGRSPYWHPATVDRWAKGRRKRGSQPGCSRERATCPECGGDFGAGAGLARHRSVKHGADDA